jgi:hypothetical protein
MFSFQEIEFATVKLMTPSDGDGGQMTRKRLVDPSGDQLDIHFNNVFGQRA